MSESILLRLRAKDTPTGVSHATAAKLMVQTDSSRTGVVHLALRRLADAYLPMLDAEDPALTPQQREAVRFSRRLPTDSKHKV